MREIANYGIRADYVSRTDNEYDVWEMGYGMEFQWDIYLRAYWLAQQHKLQSVIDYGTGNGRKLMHFFGDKATIGIDVPHTVDAFLTKAFPNYAWSSEIKSAPGFDLLICADVIEHLPDPDEFLAFVERSAPRFAVLSTPAREYLHAENLLGPPRNPCHVREWTFAEFAYYLEHRLPTYKVLEHYMVKPGDCTQAVLLERILTPEPEQA